MRIPLSISLPISDIIHSIHGEKIGYVPDEEIQYVVTHSKEAKPGDLFFAFSGERFDGHDYVLSLLKNGVFAVTERPIAGAVLVDSTFFAIGRLAAFYKSLLPSLKTTVAVTGSVGKTTVKNFLSFLLSPYYRVHSTEENQNNLLGLSYTLLKSPANTELLVLEMGSNHPGEIETLSRIAKPDMAVITSVGTAHIGHFGSREMIAKEKMTVTAGMPQAGKVFIPQGEVLLSDLPKAVTVGVEEKSDITVLCKMKDNEKSVFTYMGKDNYFESTLPVPGDGALLDLAFALAVAEASEVPLAYMKNGIEKIKSEDTRYLTKTVGGITLIDDSYNASFESVKEGLKRLSLSKAKRKIVLLGDILELGTFTKEIHEKIGKMLASMGVDYAFFYGIYAPYYKAGALAGGLKEEKVHVNLDKESPVITTQALLSLLTPGDVLYGKASNAVRLSRIFVQLSDKLQKEG